MSFRIKYNNKNKMHAVPFVLVGKVLVNRKTNKQKKKFNK